MLKQLPLVSCVGIDQKWL